MKLISEFFTLLTSEIGKLYFPDVKYYRDNKHTTKIHYAIECFNNGVLTYEKLINTISKNTKDTKENIHNIVSKYIEDFDGFELNIITNENLIPKEEIVQTIVNNVATMVNNFLPYTKTLTKYKAQEILEDVIKKLNELV